MGLPVRSICRPVRSRGLPSDLVARRLPTGAWWRAPAARPHRSAPATRLTCRRHRIHRFEDEGQPAHRHRPPVILAFAVLRPRAWSPVRACSKTCSACLRSRSCGVGAAAPLPIVLIGGFLAVPLDKHHPGLDDDCRADPGLVISPILAVEASCSPARLGSHHQRQKFDLFEAQKASS